MSDLPPPRPGEQPVWQPPAGPPPGATPDSSSGSEPAPIRPYLPEPAGTKGRPGPPAPLAAPAPAISSTAPTAPTAPARPARPEPPTTTAPVPSPSGPDAPLDDVTHPASDDRPTSFTPTSFTPTSFTPTSFTPTSITPTSIIPTSFTPTSIIPTIPPARSGRRSRWLAVIGAIIAVALGAAVVLWATRSKDDDSPDTASSTSDATDASTTDASAVVETTAPEPTSASEPPPTTGAAVVLPTTPPTAAPTAPADTSAPAGSVLPAPPVPAGATLFSDPAGWTIAIDPGWQRQQSEQFSGWFTGTGSTGFSDNVNVVIEALPNPLSLDDYVGAATGVINTQAADVEIIDQRRLIGDDGVEVHVITWLGTVVGANQRLAFVQAMTVTTTKAYVATFTSQPGRLADLALSIGPYLATIRGT